MPRVLVVDDEVGLRVALGRGLTARGFEVSTAADGPSALRAVLTGGFDVIVLDVLLPGVPGDQVLQRIRAAGLDTPVLLISGRCTEVDQAHGLDLGADGYLVKPFHFEVLVARLRALLRRRGAGEPRRLHVGGLVIDPSSRCVSYAGDTVELTYREFAVLHALAGRPNTIVSKAELLDTVWERSPEADPNVVEVYVGYLRRKLRMLGADHLVRTVRGRGYVLPAGQLVSGVRPTASGSSG